MTTTSPPDTDPSAAMSKEDMVSLIEQHLAAEMAGDVDGALAVYTDDVTHDVVGAPHGPLHGVDGARQFYDELTANFHTLEMKVNREHYGGRLLRDRAPGDR